MLYFHYTEKLVNLQGLIVKNVVQDHFSTTIFAQMPRKPHKCPCFNISTDKVHDYRKQRIKDIPNIDKEPVKNGFCGRKTFTSVKKRLLE